MSNTPTQLEQLARGLARRPDEFTVHTNRATGSTFATLPGNDTRWLLTVSLPGTWPELKEDR